MGNKKIGSVTTDYGYLNQARNHLNLLTTQESHSKLKGLRKNFATAAIIALASGTTLLFSTHTVKADETNDATVQKNEPATTTLVQKTDELHRLLVLFKLLRLIPRMLTIMLSKMHQRIHLKPYLRNKHRKMIKQVKKMLMALNCQLIIRITLKETCKMLGIKVIKDNIL